MLFNKNRLITLMDQFELDAVVASTAENIFYLSGFSSWSQHAYHYENVQVYVVFPRDESQQPTLLIPGGDLGYAALKEVWIQQIHNYGRKRTPKISENADLSPEEERILFLADQAPKGGTPEEALVFLLQEKGLQNSRIGVDQAGIPLPSMEKIRSLLSGSNILLASNFFRNVRMIKTGDEIERLRQTAKLNEIAATAMLKQAKPGVSEDEVASAYRREIARAGGEIFWLHLTASQGFNLPPIKDRILQSGNIMRADMGCSYQGYQADTCRAGCVGTPGDKQQRIYEALQAGVLKSVELLKPGVYPSELYEAMIQGVRAGGIPDYSNFFAGHTIGLEAREFPFLIGPEKALDDPFLPKTSEVPMEPGMVVNIEASNHELGWGSVAVEYTLVVTDNGNEHIIPPQQRLYSLPLE